MIEEITTTKWRFRCHGCKRDETVEDVELRNKMAQDWQTVCAMSLRERETEDDQHWFTLCPECAPAMCSLRRKV